MSAKDMSEIIAGGMAKYREKMVGRVLSAPPSNSVATADAIRHFADGLGDPNPLWRDPAYAAASPYGHLVAPPAFLNAVYEGQTIIGLPGLIATFVGARWEWGEPIAVGDSFSVDNELLPISDKTKPGEPVKVFQQGVIRYRNQRGELAGSCRWDMMRSQAKLGGGKPKSAPAKTAKAAPSPEPRTYGMGAIEAIYAALEAERARGAEPRYWQDVAVGDEVPPVLKGPLSLSDMVAWAIGISWHRAALAHGPKLKFLRENPGLSYTDPSTCFPEPIAMSHMEPRAARILMGSDLPMDVGFQRVAWFTHPLTNWMGDAGRLKSLEVRLKGFVRFGDICRLQGKVRAKSREKEQCLVELAMTATNQRGEEVASGEAAVILPSREREE